MLRLVVPSLPNMRRQASAEKPLLGGASASAWRCVLCLRAGRHVLLRCEAVSFAGRRWARRRDHESGRVAREGKWVQLVGRDQIAIAGTLDFFSLARIA